MPESAPPNPVPGATGDPPLPAKITICMGSSCFSRGNGRNIEVVQEFLKKHPLPASVEISGHLCEGQCKSGPNVSINGKMYHEVDPIVIIALLNHFLPKNDAGPK